MGMHLFYTQAIMWVRFPPLLPNYPAGAYPMEDCLPSNAGNICKSVWSNGMTCDFQSQNVGSIPTIDSILVMMKLCYKCDTHLPLTAFSKNSSRPDGHNSQCKDCHSAYRRKHYQENRKKVHGQIKMRRQELTEYVRLQRLGKECVRCGVSDHRALHFHHRNPSDKDFSLAQAGERGVSIETIELEIAKCDLICANCHAIEHSFYE